MQPDSSRSELQVQDAGLAAHAGEPYCSRTLLNQRGSHDLSCFRVVICAELLHPCVTG